MGSYRVCVCFLRRFRVAEAVPPDDIRDLFHHYSDGGAKMTPDQLRRFLSVVQGEDVDLDVAQKVVEQVVRKRHHIITKLTRHSLSLHDFFHFLFSELNPPITSQVQEDMTAPLTHYFIYTGHNSYLTGNQLSSDSSDIPIIKALKRGVKVIELDLWPNSSKDDVHVLHGRTWTIPVELIICLRSIKEHAFSASPYPVIITLEDHLTPDLQAKVAKMIKQTFGDMLFCPDHENLKVFPSPEELKYKVMISTRPPKEYLSSKSVNENSKKLQKSKDSDEDDWGKEVTEVVKGQNEDDMGDSDTNQLNGDDDGSETNQQSDYKRLIAIHAGKPKGSLKEALKVEDDQVRRLSLSEQDLEKATESLETDLIRFTQKNFLRVYPKGTRFNSSNYEPLIGWMHGAQMVAFNMQGNDRNLWLMHGMFRSNGGCGYVKKPDLLIHAGPNNEVFNPKDKLKVKKTLKVKLYMGDGWLRDFKRTHFDFYSPPDFYARVGIAGVPADNTEKTTKTIRDDWIPAWEQEFTFPLTVPELALLRVEVYEYDNADRDDFAGQTCLRLAELKQGIRAVPLYDLKGEKYYSVRLLMKFEFI